MKEKTSKKSTLDNLINYVNNHNNDNNIRTLLNTIYEDSNQLEKSSSNKDIHSICDYVYKQIQNFLVAPENPYLDQHAGASRLIRHTVLEAIRNTHVDLIKWLVKITDNLSGDKIYENFVHAIKNTSSLAQFIIKMNWFLKDPHSNLINCNYKEITPLYQAVACDNFNMIQLLLKNGADPDLSLGRYGSPRQLAVTLNGSFASLLLNSNTSPLTTLLNAMQNKKALLIAEIVHRGGFYIYSHHKLPFLQKNTQEDIIFKNTSCTIFAYLIEYQEKLMCIYVPQQLMTYLFDYLMPFRVLNTAENNIFGENSGGNMDNIFFYLGSAKKEEGVKSFNEISNHPTFKDKFPDHNKTNIQDLHKIYAGFYIPSNKHPTIDKSTTTINGKKYSLSELFDFMCDNFPELYFAATTQNRERDKDKIDKDEVYKQKYLAIKEREILIDSFCSTLRVCSEDEDAPFEIKENRDEKRTVPENNLFFSAAPKKVYPQEPIKDDDKNIKMDI